MIDDIRPNPDQILESLNRREKKKRGGRLYLFLGMAPGVGKTYAMILAAQEAKKKGTDILVGVVETHKRKETEELLAGLSFLPKIPLEYRGKHFSEMDLDGILSRKPRLVLVDELAHSNAPGSRHAKRWQDVFELLDAGIDVFSTLNVQHLESRKETVEQIAGIKVAETVPDSVIDRAHQIRLIDLSPEELLKRLSEGKVYLGEQANLAAENFFKEDRLTALREISLRLMAEKVDADLQSYSTERSLDEHWLVSERLLVLVEANNSSEARIRATRKLAFNLEATWIAAYVDNGLHLSDKEQQQLAKNLQLARSLGAEITTLTDTNVALALARLAAQKSVTQIIIGRKDRRDTFFKQGLLEVLVKATNSAIHIIREPETKRKKFRGPYQLNTILHFKSGFPSYVKATVLIIVLSLLNFAFAPFIGYRAVGFVYLLGTLIISLFSSFGPIIWVALLTAAIWNLGFIPPIGFIKIANTDDFFMLLSYLITAVGTGILTERSSKHQRILIERETRSQMLFEVTLELSNASKQEESNARIVKKIGDFLSAQLEIVLVRKNGQLKEDAFASLGLQHIEKEKVVAQWAFENQKPAGWSTDTLAGAEAFYIPLKGSLEKIGVLVFKPLNNKHLSIGDQDLLFSIARQLSISLEKDLFRERASRAEYTEKLYKLNKGALGLLSELMDKAISALKNTQENLSLAPINSFFRYKENLLLATHIFAGNVPLQRQKIAAKTFIENCLTDIENSAGKIQFYPDELDGIELFVDPLAMKKALVNILTNMKKDDQKETSIAIAIRSMKTSTNIILKGSSVVEELIDKTFEKLSLQSLREPEKLSLAVAKGIIKAHGGKISIEEQKEGLSFMVSLPK